MLAASLSTWWVHDVSLSRFAGEGAYGSIWEPVTVLRGFIEDRITEVRGPSGEQVVSSARVYMPADTDTVGVGSTVEFRGEVHRVISTALSEAGPLPTPNHLTLYLE